MKNTQRNRGFSSVMAMIFLAIMAAMSVGFYSAIEMGTAVADNQQYIQRSSVAAESALTFGKYQLDQISLPASTWPGNLMTALNSYLGTSLNGTSNMGSTNPTAYNTGTPPASFSSAYNSSISGYLNIPGVSNGSPTWMTMNGLGSQAYLELASVPGGAGNTMNVLMMAVGANSNSRVTSMTRKEQVQFNFYNPIFTYGLASYGEIFFTPPSGGSVTVTNDAGYLPVSVLSLAATGVKPIQVNGASSFSGYFYYTNNTNKTSITWGNAVNGKLTVDGQVPYNGQYGTVHPNSGAPATPTFDSSPYAQFASNTYPAVAPSGAGNFTYSDASTTLTNVSLQPPSSGTSVTYAFNNLSTINGVLYLPANVNVNFNNAAGLTINGWIVRANGVGGKVTFNAPVVQNQPSASTPGLSADELELVGTNTSGMALLLPNDTIAFNSTATMNGSIIGANITFNGNVNVYGSILNMGSSSMVFNSTVTVTVDGGGGQAPVGVNGSYVPVPASYTEVYP